MCLPLTQQTGWPKVAVLLLLLLLLLLLAAAAGASVAAQAHQQQRLPRALLPVCSLGTPRASLLAAAAAAPRAARGRACPLLLRGG
jgi:hypothetical protein